MLAPSAITVRRPSGEVDLILSKSEQRIGTASSQEFFVPPLRNCKSENTSPVNSCAPSPSGSASLLPQNPKVVATSSNGTPQTPKKCWFRKVVKLKEDLDRISKAIKMKKSGGSTEHLCWILTPPSEMDANKRAIHVETVPCGRKALTCCKLRCRTMSTEQDDHNFSAGLIMTKLGDGYFNAELSISSLPIGDIIIRLCNYRLEILLMDTLGAKFKNESSKNETKAKYCGSVSMPIYVMPETLEVVLDSDRNVLLLQAMTKGYQLQRNSCSFSDLRDLEHNRTSPTSPATSPVLVENAKTFGNLRNGSEEQDLSSLYVSDGMRDRANTK